MTDIAPLTCEQLRDCAPELAFGILPARERAAATAHLQHCPTCREHVREVLRTADGLVELIPGIEPPVGFEARVVQRIGLPSAQRPRHAHRLRRRVALAASAAATAFAVGVGGWAVGQAADSPVPAAPPSTVPHQGGSLVAGGLAAAGQPIGRAFAYTGSSPWVFVSVDADTTAGAIDGKVWCQIQRSDGSTAMVGSFPISDGYAQWGGAYPVGSAPVTSLRLLTADGSAVATAAFPATTS